jgi:tetratricopeptide (TPR) repeat protein
MGLLSIGFEDYDRDALNALSKALDLNPTNYELYYNAAQVYLVQENSDDALAMLVKVLEINPRHVPSLLMAGEVNKGLGKEEVYLSYLKAAKAIMEEYNQDDTDIYQEVVRDLRQVEGTPEE